MGSHTRVAPWGKTISTRVATSKLRHLSVGRGSNALCANESLGNAAAAGRIALALRNARLSMSVLLSIEALSHNAGLGVPARSAWSTRCRSLQEGLRGWVEGAAEEREASAEGRPPPSISPSGRHVPREPAGCAKPIITASERELREIKRCWMIIGTRSGGNGRIPKRTSYSENVPDHKSRWTGPARTSARGKKLFDRIFNGLRIPLQIARHGITDALLAIEHQSRGQHLHLPRGRGGSVAIEQHREAHRDFLQELVDPRRALVEVHREDREGLAGELVLQPLHGGHLLAAGIAPSRPKIEHHDLAPIVGELVLLALEIAQREGRRRAAPPELQLAPGSPCPAARSNQHQGGQRVRRPRCPHAASFFLPA